MVGKKTFKAKTHSYFNLEERVPEYNLYRQLKEVIYRNFLYEAVAPYYGTCGHQSIDPCDYRALEAHIRADFADEKDSRPLLDLVKETRSRLKVIDINVYTVLADAALEAAHIEGYVALYGQYHRQREGFAGFRRLIMILEMHTSAVMVKYLITEVSEQKKVTSITIIEANSAIVRPAFVARPYQEEMLWQECSQTSSYYSFSQPI